MPAQNVGGPQQAGAEALSRESEARAKPSGRWSITGWGGVVSIAGSTEGRVSERGEAPNIVCPGDQPGRAAAAVAACAGATARCAF